VESRYTDHLTAAQPPSKDDALPAEYAPLLSVPFQCANCGHILGEAKLFCSDLCRDEAKFVRYFRACIMDGRTTQPDVLDALQIRFAHLLASGYVARARALPDATRKAVILRDRGSCQSCGAPGTQIDHIRGDSGSLDNLQLLCSRCHIEKTRSRIVPIQRESFPQEYAKAEWLMRRVEADEPQQACDRDDWQASWRRVLSARRLGIKERAKRD
jgi:5-methylcytosine-specific restriction endonuclease McrA